MLKILRPQNQKHVRSILSQCYCRLSNKASDKDQPSDISKSVNSENTSNEIEKAERQEVTKEDLTWRTPWHKKDIKYYETLRTFYSVRIEQT